MSFYVKKADIAASVVDLSDDGVVGTLEEGLDVDNGNVAEGFGFILISFGRIASVGVSR